MFPPPLTPVVSKIIEKELLNLFKSSTIKFKISKQVPGLDREGQHSTLSSGCLSCKFSSSKQIFIQSLEMGGAQKRKGNSEGKSQDYKPANLKNKLCLSPYR